MKKVNKLIFKLVLESLEDGIETHEFTPWGVEDFDNEADENGKIPATVSRFTHGGRESEESHWTIEVVSDEGDYWNVKACCTESEIRRYHVGDEIEFELYKDIDIFDVDYELGNALAESDLF